jgi:hypothetical protein
MNDYLSNLAARSLNLTEVIQPRLALPFEPPHVTGTEIPGDSFGQTSVDGEVTIKGTALDVPSKSQPQLRPAAESQPSGTGLHLSPGALQQNVSDLQATHQSLSVVSEPPATQPSARRTAESPSPEKPPQNPAVPTNATVPLRHPTVANPQLTPVLKEASPPSETAHPQHPSASKTVAIIRAATPHVMPAVHVKPEILKPALPSETKRKSTSTIQVTIGRIEVRAIMPPAAPAPRTKLARTGPTLSLEDYLKQRNEGRR